jgi:MATE family multidrug resistance protein
MYSNKSKKEKKKQSIGFSRHIRETFILAVPIIIGHLGHMLMGVTDNLMVGRVGAVSLAAAGLSNVLFFLILVMGLGISVAVTPLVAQAFGGGNDEDCGLVLSQGILVNLFSGLILFFVTLALAFFLDRFDQPPAVVEPAKNYIVILGFSIFPMMVFQSYKQFAEGLSVTRSAMVITLLANIVNVFLNWMFIFGHLGAPALGLVGAGIGTLGARTFMAFTMVVVVNRSPGLKIYRTTSSRFHMNIPMIRKILKIGIPTGLQYVFEVSSFAGASVVTGWIGAKELAAHQIALNLSSISYMFSLGVSAAATVRVGTALGRRDISGTRKAGFASAVLISCFMAFFALVFIGLKDVLPGFYVSEGDVVLIASHILVIAGFFQVSDGMQAVSAGMLRGVMDVKIPTAITFAAYWLIGIPAGYILGIHFQRGVTGVWEGLFMGLTAAGIMMFIRFVLITRRNPRMLYPG